LREQAPIALLSARIERWIASRCGWTPYEGKEVQGWPVGTIIRGTRVMWEGELTIQGQGQPVRSQQDKAADGRCSGEF
jgi:hypothetical protein